MGSRGCSGGGLSRSRAFGCGGCRRSNGMNPQRFKGEGSATRSPKGERSSRRSERILQRLARRLSCPPLSAPKLFTALDPPGSLKDSISTTIKQHNEGRVRWTLEIDVRVLIGAVVPFVSNLVEAKSNHQFLHLPLPFLDVGI